MYVSDPTGYNVYCTARRATVTFVMTPANVPNLMRIAENYLVPWKGRG